MTWSVFSHFRVISFSFSVNKKTGFSVCSPSHSLTSWSQNHPYHFPPLCNEPHIGSCLDKCPSTAYIPTFKIIQSFCPLGTLSYSHFVFISITLANRSKKKYCCYLYQRVLLPIFSSVCAEECPTLCNPLYVQRNVCAEYVQSCPALCNPMDCSPPGCPIHGIFHTRILE